MRKKSFASVWDALADTPQEAASMRLKSAAMIAIQQYVRESGLSQTAAAKSLGITQPRLSDLMRGRIDLFSLDTLVNMAATAGLDPQLRLRIGRVDGKRSAARDAGGHT